MCSIRKHWGVGGQGTVPRTRDKISLWTLLRSKNLPTLVFQGGERPWPRAAGFGLRMLREFLLIPKWFRSSASPGVAEHPRCPSRPLGKFYIPRCSVLKPGLKPALLQRLSGICWKNSHQFGLSQSQTGDSGAGGCAYDAFSETPSLELIPTPIN